MGALANMTQYVTSEKFDGVVKAIELTNEVGDSSNLPYHP